MQTVPVEVLDDPRIADYRNVRDASLRTDRGVFLAEGRKNVERLVGTGRFRTRSVLVTPAALAALRPSLEGLPDRVPVFVAPQALVSRIVGYDLHRGALAVGVRGAPRDFARDLAAAGPDPGLWVALEHVTNPDNVGGILRNALAFGADYALLTSRCADPLYRKSIRVSMGASLRVPFAPAPAWPRELATLRSAGFAVVALVADRDATPLASLPFEKDTAGVVMVVGNEGEGVSSAVRAGADHCATIPMAPGIDSLNAAVASGIALSRIAAALGRIPG